MLLSVPDLLVVRSAFHIHQSLGPLLPLIFLNDLIHNLIDHLRDIDMLVRYLELVFHLDNIQSFDQHKDKQIYHQQHLYLVHLQSQHYVANMLTLILQHPKYYLV